MIKTAKYIEFEEGFLKEAEAQGCEIPFLRGLIAEADEIHEKWAAAFEEIEKESGDPQFRTKLSNELVYWMIRTAPMEKDAEGGLQGTLDTMEGWPNQIGNLLSGAETGANPDFNQHGTMGSMVGGGVGGGLLGLIVSLITQSNPMLGMLLGSLGGAGIMKLLQSGALGNMLRGGGKPSDAAQTLEGRQGPVNHLQDLVNKENPYVPGTHAAVEGQPETPPAATPAAAATPAPNPEEQFNAARAADKRQLQLEKGLTEEDPNSTQSIDYAKAQRAKAIAGLSALSPAAQMPEEEPVQDPAFSSPAPNLRMQSHKNPYAKPAAPAPASAQPAPTPGAAPAQGGGLTLKDLTKNPNVEFNPKVPMGSPIQAGSVNPFAGRRPQMSPPPLPPAPIHPHAFGQGRPGNPMTGLVKTQSDRFYLKDLLKHAFNANSMMPQSNQGSGGMMDFSAPSPEGGGQAGTQYGDSFDDQGGMQNGMAGPDMNQNPMSGPMTGPMFGGGVPGTTSVNPMLPPYAPMVVPPNQPSMTPGGSVMTNKRPMPEI